MSKDKKLVLVGVLQDERKKGTLQLAETIFSSLGYRPIYETKTRSLLILGGERELVFFVDLNSENISVIANMGIEFHILIHSLLEKEAYNCLGLRKILDETSYLLVNSDEDNWPPFVNGLNKPILLTYGFNNKATINISSYNMYDLAEANICLQRRLLNMEGNIIEPFELPIKVRTNQNLDIYSAIAIMATGLIMGLDISSIKSHLSF